MSGSIVLYCICPVPETARARRCYAPDARRQHLDHKARCEEEPQRGYEKQSGRGGGFGLRLHRPERCALPGCAAPRPGARCTEPADDSKRPGGAARAAPARDWSAPPSPKARPQKPDLVRGQPDRIVADVVGTAVDRGSKYPQRPPLRLRDVVLQRDVERAAAAGPQVAIVILSTRTLREPSSNATRKVASKTLELPVIRAGLARHRTPVDPRRSMEAAHRSPSAIRPIEHDPLRTERGDGAALDLEQDRADGRELGQRVDDLGEPVPGRGGSHRRIELTRQIGRGDAVLDGDPEQLRSGWMAVESWPYWSSTCSGSSSAFIAARATPALFGTTRRVGATPSTPGAPSRM